MSNFDRGTNYVKCEEGVVKIPMWIMNKKVNDYMTPEEKIVFMCTLVIMQATKTEELQIELEELADQIGMEEERVAFAIRRLSNYGFFREIYAEKGIDTSAIYLVNMNLHLQ